MAQEKPVTSLEGGKRWLREVLVRRRQSLSPSQRKRMSLAAVRRLLRHPSYRKAKIVALFMGFGSEIHTDFLVQQSWKDRKRVLLPMTARGFHKPYFALFRRGDKLRRSPFGPLELQEKHDAFDFSEIDLVVVPGLGFDRRGYRIGYGGGVYDRMLAQARRALHVGLFFSAQEVFAVPRGRHDHFLDAVATDREILSFSARFRRKA